jgi:hypothetical protein
MAFSSRYVSWIRFAVTAAIVAVWLALMGSLVRDHYFPPVSQSFQSFQLASVEAEDWFTVRIRGAYSGFGRSRQLRKGNDWLVKDDLHLSLNIQGLIKPVEITAEAHVDADFRLLSFKLKVASGIISFEQSGHMEGRDLVLESPARGGGTSRRITMFEAPRMSRSLGLPLPLTGLKVGDDFRVPVFDPMDGQKWDAEIKVLEKADIDVSGTKVEGWRVRAVYRAMELTVWIDKEGRLLKGQLPLGITVARSSKEEIASQTPGVRRLPDIAALASVPVDGVMPDLAGLKLLRLEVQGLQNSFVPSDDFRQKFTGSELALRREAAPEASYAIPCTDPKMAEFLAPSRFIRSDSPEIIDKAREIIGAEKDPVKAAALINRWVFANLKKVPTPSVPDAVSVLNTKQGDCNEHAVLAVALARAVGVPGRIALGLVYMEGSFYYHAWVNYWAGTRWFSADPLMGQLPADMSHVTLIYGDVDKHVNVMSFLGKLKLKVLAAE